MGNSGCFPQGKPAVTVMLPSLRCMLKSDMDHRISNMRADVNECYCTQGCTDTCKRVCTRSWLWEKNPLPHWGIEPASVVWWSDAVPNELQPHLSELFNTQTWPDICLETFASACSHVKMLWMWVAFCFVFCFAINKIMKTRKQVHDLLVSVW